MSFGDITPPRTPAAPPAASPAVPDPSPHPVTQLQGSFKALATNTRTLRRLTALLHSPDSSLEPLLKQVRDLREQTRHIASTLASRLTHPAHRTRFNALHNEFLVASRESEVAEEAALRRMRQVELSRQQTMDESVVALTEQEIQSSRSRAHAFVTGGHGATETDPLLGGRRVTVGAQDRAVLREVRANEGLVTERNEALSKIQTDAENVNASFKDLASMIGSQSEQVEFVEVAVAEAAVAVGRGGRELVKTQVRKESTKGVFFCALLSIALVIALMVVIVLS